MSFYLDTETTGLHVEKGDRIVSLGLVDENENEYYWIFNPERPSNPESEKIHGLTSEILKNEKRFLDYAEEIFNLINGKKIIAYNSPFDEKFLVNEFLKCGYHLDCQWVDACALARRKIQLKRYRLDDICSLFQISSERKIHNSLEDAKLVKEVYQILMYL